MTLGNHDQGHKQGQWPRSYMKQTIQFIYTTFVSCKSDHAFLGHRQFIIWPRNFEVKVNAEFKEKISINLVAIWVVIVAKTNSKYGINTCICIYFFYFWVYFNLQITIKDSGH